MNLEKIVIRSLNYQTCLDILKSAILPSAIRQKLLKRLGRSIYEKVGHVYAPMDVFYQNHACDVLCTARMIDILDQCKLTFNLGEYKIILVALFDLVENIYSHSNYCRMRLFELLFSFENPNSTLENFLRTYYELCFDVC